MLLSNVHCSNTGATDAADAGEEPNTITPPPSVLELLLRKAQPCSAVTPSLLERYRLLPLLLTMGAFKPVGVAASRRF